MEYSLDNFIGNIFIEEALEAFGLGLEKKTMEGLWPVYISLFSNKTQFGKVIRFFTGSAFSHATVSLDPTLNNMYSFSDKPLTRHYTMLDQKAGFVRESLWSPEYGENEFFTVLITFVNTEGYNKIIDKLHFFRENYKNYKYNDVGLVKYFIESHKHKPSMYNSTEYKTKWFCSEFVAYLLDESKVPGFAKTLVSPGDILRNKAFFSKKVDYNIDRFTEADLIRQTDKAKAQYIEHMKHLAQKAAEKGNVERVRVVAESNITAEEIEKIYAEYLNDEALESSITAKITNRKIDPKIEDAVGTYTALLDWKSLYDAFIQCFPYTDIDKRFDIIEMIIRKYIIHIKPDPRNVEELIKKEMRLITKNDNNKLITSVNVDNGTFTSVKGGTEYTRTYIPSNKSK